MTTLVKNCGTLLQNCLKLYGFSVSYNIIMGIKGQNQTLKKEFFHMLIVVISVLKLF